LEILQRPEACILSAAWPATIRDASEAEAGSRAE